MYLFSQKFRTSRSTERKSARKAEASVSLTVTAATSDAPNNDDGNEALATLLITLNVIFNFDIVSLLRGNNNISFDTDLQTRQGKGTRRRHPPGGRRWCWSASRTPPRNQGLEMGTEADMPRVLLQVRLPLGNTKTLDKTTANVMKFEEVLHAR